MFQRKFIQAGQRKRHNQKKLQSDYNNSEETCFEFDQFEDNYNFDDLCNKITRLNIYEEELENVEKQAKILGESFNPNLLSNIKFEQEINAKIIVENQEFLNNIKEKISQEFDSDEQSTEISEYYPEIDLLDVQVSELDHIEANSIIQKSVNPQKLKTKQQNKTKKEITQNINKLSHFSKAISK